LEVIAPIVFTGEIFADSAKEKLARGSLTCKYCQQRELGCPADLLFTKKK